MKKITLMFSALCLVAGSFAQEISYAPILGLNMSNVGGDTKDAFDDKNKMKIGYQLGGIADVNFGAFGIQPGLLLSNKGFKVEEGDVKVKMSATYLEIPVNLYYGFDVSENQVRIIAGPYLGLGLFGKAKWEAAGESEDWKIKFKNDVKEGDLADDETAMARTDFGLNFGAGFKTGPILIQALYGIGLSNINPKYEGEEDEDSLKNRNIQLSVAYFFGK